MKVEEILRDLVSFNTINDLQNLLVDAIPGFEFPRKDLYNYEINIVELNSDEAMPDDFIVGTVWGEVLDENLSETPIVLVDKSSFGAELSSEEINILALLMK
jgi:hypothetical protein